MWSVTVQGSTPFNDKQWHVANHADSLAMELSGANPGRRVSVEAMARVRRVVVDCKIITDMPDLGHFYTNVSEKEAWVWKEFLEVLEG